MVYCAANWYCFCLTEQTQRGRESKSRRDAPARRAAGGAVAAGTPCPPCPAASPGVTHPWGFVVVLWVLWASLVDEPSRARLVVSPVQVCVRLLRAGSRSRWAEEGFWWDLLRSCGAGERGPAGTWLSPEQALGCGCSFCLRGGENTSPLWFLADGNILSQEIQRGWELVT